MRYAQNLPILLSNVGKWWGTDAKTRKEIQMLYASDKSYIT